MFSVDLPSLKLWHGKEAGKHKTAIAGGEQKQTASASFTSVYQQTNLHTTDVH
jgi:hypothetical protein